jgi:LacI family transcriptional regulator
MPVTFPDESFPIVSQTNITIRDVAKIAGVSVSTVSRVLNGKGDVAPTTAVHVNQVIADLGYTASLAATSMRSARKRVIGMVVSDLCATFSLEVIRGVGQVLQALDYDLIIYSSGRQAPSSEVAWTRRHIVRLNGGITDGLVIVAPPAASLPTGYPLVVIDPHEGHSDLPAVMATNREGARGAVEYLLQLGHRRIGMVGGRAGLLSAAQRDLGYVDALTAAGLAVDPSLVGEGDYTLEGGYAVGQRLLSMPDRPTAIFAANDLSAFGVMQAARELNVAVPAALSIVGFDDIPEAAASCPPLTTVAQPIHEMAHVAARLLVDLVQARALPVRRLQVPTRLVVRNSCERYEPVSTPPA